MSRLKILWGRIGLAVVLLASAVGYGLASSTPTQPRIIRQATWFECGSVDGCWIFSCWLASTGESVACPGVYGGGAKKI